MRGRRTRTPPGSRPSEVSDDGRAAEETGVQERQRAGEQAPGDPGAKRHEEELQVAEVEPVASQERASPGREHGRGEPEE